MSTERDYLLAEAEAARRGIAGTLGDLRLTTRRLADPAYWCRTHPWASVIAVGSAAAVAAGALRNRLTRADDKPDAAPQPRRRIRSLLVTIGRVLFLEAFVRAGRADVTYPDAGPMTPPD